LTLGPHRRAIDSYPIGCEKRETRQLQITSLDDDVREVPNCLRACTRHFRFGPCGGHSSGAGLSLSFSDDMSQKGGVGTKLRIVYLEYSNQIPILDVTREIEHFCRAHTLVGLN